MDPSPSLMEDNMIFIDNKTTNPHFNLALEEYLLTKFDDEVFMIWQNEKSIIVGKNQNTLSQINYEYVRANKINVARRITGGGTVYHDHGNLNYTFISKFNGEFNLYSVFVAPIIEVLNDLGAKAELKGRNDIVIKDKKISGNAQCVLSNRILCHGTLLYDSNIDVLETALDVAGTAVSSVGVKSVRSRVTNILEQLDQQIDIDAFRTLVIAKIVDKYNAVRYELSPDDIAQVNKKVEEKFGTWDWNYGYSPAYSFKKKIRKGPGDIEFNIEVKDGIIKEVKIFGDFFSQLDKIDIETALKGIRHNPELVTEVLSKFDIDKYFWSLTIDDLIECMF